jgi:tripeptidyl-peptidase I
MLLPPSELVTNDKFYSGATQINPGAKVTDPESACEQVIFSGGGFSNVFSVPEYQRAAQAKYFAEHNPPYNSTQFNNSQTVGFLWS